MEYNIWTTSGEMAENIAKIYNLLFIPYKSEKIDKQWNIKVASDNHRLLTLAEDIWERLAI